MIKIKLGDYNDLTVQEVAYREGKGERFGLYLDGGRDGEILMPDKYVPEGTQVGDTLRVFVYLDQEERPIATTEKPLARVDEFAYLQCAWVNQYGAFLHWGVMKDLFCPCREQKKRMEELLADENTAWRVSEEDLWQNKKHKKCSEVYQTYMEQTNQSYAPWYAIDAKSKKWAELQILERINQNIETALANSGRAVPILPNLFPLSPIPKLADVDLNKELTEEEYQEKLEKLQKRLSELHNVLYREKIPVIIAYEGWDAAGKGGNIKRIAAALDARGYEVHPIASPEPHEKNRHFLWRFWTRLPKSGHIAIFDRTWYGRVMVERLEGFCSENDWQRAYNEINEFEKELDDWGAVIVKFWVQIDKDTQLERFTLRQNTPEKRWKITDEDWRNREKWDLYQVPRRAVQPPI